MKEDQNNLFFDSFNARFLSPEEVAKSYEPPPHFQDLLRRCHSLIVGPRGSGKTSMLKMLQLPALNSWTTDFADAAKLTLDYTGVFIATDIVWHEQVQAIASMGFSKDEVERLEDSCITLHVLKSLATSFNYRARNSGGFLGVEITDTQEREISKYLANLWQLNIEIDSFAGLLNSLSLKLADVGYFIAEESLRSSQGRLERLLARKLVMPSFFELVGPSVDAFDAMVQQPGARWALCFDELELAPSRLKQSLVRRLRSTTDKILFKLSMSLYSDANEQNSVGSIAPSEDDDFNVISLWYAHKAESKKFTERLVSRMLRSRDIELSPEEVFGESFLMEGQKRGGYRRDTPQARLLQELKDRDPSFAKYLQKRGINPARIAELDELTRAAEIRKIYPLAVHRRFFMRPALERQQRSPVGRGQTMASRSSYRVYTGWDAIAAICEGNPRWIIGVVSAMLDRNQYKRRGFPVSPDIQWEVIEQVGHRFRSKLKTYKVVDSGLDRGAFKLLDQIGKFFGKELFGNEFKPEPVSSFRVDAEAFRLYGEALKAALNIGAIVYIPDENTEMFIGSIKEKRFRISYLLLTFYKVPLRFGAMKTLSRIITNSSSEQIILDLKEDEN